MLYPCGHDGKCPESGAKECRDVNLTVETRVFLFSLIYTFLNLDQL